MSNRIFQWGYLVAFVVASLGTNFANGQDAVKKEVIKKEVVKKEVVKEDGVAGKHYRAKEILGSKVQIEEDTEVGTVDDIVLDDNGNVDYLIVVNSDDKLVTVPWDATQFNSEKRVAVVHITAAKFKEVPTYTAERYPVFSTPTYRVQVYKAYGLTPGQERRLIRRGALDR